MSIKTSRQRGVALIELALAIPFLILLSLLATEFGRAIYQYNTIAKSVRDAARYLAMQTPNTHITEANNLVLYGTTTSNASSVPLVSGLSLSNLPPGSTPIWQTAGSNPVINTVTITVQGFCFTPMIANVFGVAFTKPNQSCNGIPFSNISATMRAPT
jgi:Flp pilus assembly protein TadG